jgi:hypothetical protein
MRRALVSIWYVGTLMAIRIVWYGTELLSHRRRAVTIYDQVTDYGRMDIVPEDVNESA